MKISTLPDLESFPAEKREGERAGFRKESLMNKASKFVFCAYPNKVFQTYNLQYRGNVSIRATNNILGSSTAIYAL